jgi:nucleoside-diphosphate-sugar epimerase
MPRVLITGASGFIAGHCILEMLNHGYEVRGTLRSLSRADAIKSVLRNHTDRIEALEFASADLMDEASWVEAARGCDGVLHVASPVPVIQPDDEDEVIIPAKTGTLNVLKAAKANGIKRVVLTSSTAAVLAGKRDDGTFTDKDWTDLSRTDLSPYIKSKTIAEKSAWEYADQNNDLELATVNPALVLGPALEADYGSSLEALYLLLTGAYPILPKLGFEIVDVRDVAALHRLALETPEAAGNRYLCANGFRWFVDIAKTVKAEHPDKKIPTSEMPNLVARLASVFLKEIKQFLPNLGRVKHVDNAPARAIGWEPRDVDTAIKDGARSLVDLGII